ANGKPLLFPDDPHVVGIASDVAIETRLPVVHLDDIEDVAELMLRSAIPVDDVLASASAES
ncbi:MAG TPA: molybdopterin-guanine dinucleotide biosynthesis protein MobB, partial [Bradyrhizobium sp.]|nr:molybdopterin-guanine dinucleotide biosynthesis protein MobB [Bradyrhizobium sp.]